MAKRTLYFIGTQYTGKPVFTVRSSIYQPKGIGDVLLVDERDVADLISKAQIYGKDGRTYQGFTADPHVAAAIKAKVDKGETVVGVPVDATLAEQLRIAVPTAKSDVSLDDLSLTDLEELLTRKRNASKAKDKPEAKPADKDKKSEE